MKHHIHLMIILIASSIGCQTRIPVFNGNAAFTHLVAQCDFGPATPVQLDIKKH